jgi:hypothetical protein
MRYLITVVACILAGSAVAAERESFQLRTAGDLVRVCSVAETDPDYGESRGFCHGILVGAYHYYDAAVTPSKRFVCSPNPPPKRSKVMNDFVAWGNAHPQYMKDPAVDTLFKYLASTYPCKK